jgi:hypothetical protein
VGAIPLIVPPTKSVAYKKLPYISIPSCPSLWGALTGWLTAASQTSVVVNAMGILLPVRGTEKAINQLLLRLCDLAKKRFRKSTMFCFA